MQRTVKILDLGQRDYDETWEIQRQIQQEVVKNPEAATVIFVEHPPVITLGKNATLEYVNESQEQLSKIGVKLVQSDRGGDVTGHFPGQLVAYPILHLGSMDLAPKRYVDCLEQTMIESLREFGIFAARDEINPGVWVSKNKIGAIGIRIKERVSMHGLALNVNTDLKYFNLITPCGIKGRGVTSMERELLEKQAAADININMVKPILKERLLTIMGFRENLNTD